MPNTISAVSVRNSCTAFRTPHARSDAKIDTSFDRIVLFDALRKNADAIRRVGERAVEEARRLGVPCHYMDADVCAGIIREMPDGSRQRVELRDGREIAVESL